MRASERVSEGSTVKLTLKQQERLRARAAALGLGESRYLRALVADALEFEAVTFALADVLNDWGPGLPTAAPGRFLVDVLAETARVRAIALSDRVKDIRAGRTPSEEPRLTVANIFRAIGQEPPAK